MADSDFEIKNGVLIKYKGNDKIVEISAGVTEIGEEAFFGCLSLEKIIVSPKNKYYSSDKGILFDKNKTILVKCPQGFEYESYSIPDSVTEIINGAFEFCKSLKEINVSPDNECYSSDKGILFDKDKTILVRCPQGFEYESYSVPDSVTKIGGSAFEGCSSLKKIYAPKGLDLSDTYYPEDCAIIRY